MTMSSKNVGSLLGRITDGPGSAGRAPTPSRVNKLRMEKSNSTEWESDSEKEFHGNVNIVQSWEELSVDSESSMSSSAESSSTSSSYSGRVWFSIPSPASKSSSFSSFSTLATPSPTASASPVISRSRMSFSPGRVPRLTPKTKTVTSSRRTRTSLRSPTLVRPSLLSGSLREVKRKFDWSSDSEDADCRSPPAKKL